MNNIPSSLFLGPLFLLAFFIGSVVIVAGIKIFWLYIRRTPVKLKPAKPKRVKISPQVKSAVSEKPVRSIEINPDEVDKIYVKKVS